MSDRRRGLMEPDPDAPAPPLHELLRVVAWIAVWVLALLLLSR